MLLNILVSWGLIQYYIICGTGSIFAIIAIETFTTFASLIGLERRTS